MAVEMGISDALAQVVAQTKWSDLPVPVQHQAKRSFMNYFAVALGGCRTTPVNITLRSLTASSGGLTGTLIGRRERVDPMSTAFLNAASANVFDFCDTHVDTGIHPTAPIASACLALGESRHSTGSDVLAALVIGQEIACRIGMAISPSHYSRGWHITSTCGVLGAAAACSSLLGLQKNEVVAALGISATQSAGLCECLGTGAKSVSVGNAARHGMWSATLAAEGLDGPSEPISGKQGLFAALAGPVNRSALFDGLGESWQILKTSYKPYPCGFVIHPVLDCILEWRSEHPQVEIQTIVVRGHALLIARADRPHISTGRESQVSVQHAVAAALIWGRVGVESFSDEAVNDPRAIALRGRISVVHDTTHLVTSARLDINTVDGHHYVRTQACARGSEANPMSDLELETKLRLAENGGSVLSIENLINAIWEFDRCRDVGSILRLTTPDE